jgi:hypothetical protein
MKIHLTAFAAAAVLLAGAPAFAHHSAAMFDSTKELTVAGTVKQFQFTNPHSWLIVTANDAQGKAVDWNIELGAPTMILRMGINRSTFAVGDKVTVHLHPMKDGRSAGEFLSVQKADGSVVSTRIGPPPPPAPGA